MQALKGKIPSVILKSCLDDMALDNFDKGTQFADSDEDDDEDGKGKATAAAAAAAAAKKKKAATSGDEFAGSLKLKAGRNANTTLYYVDYSRLFNNGNGLLPEDKNDLVCANEKAKAELEASNLICKQMTAETTKLLSEPTNADAVVMLEKEEADVAELRNQVEESRGLESNEKHRKELKKRIQVMTFQWRNRRRTCMDFLNTMEEASDGAISVKKVSAYSSYIRLCANANTTLTP